MGEGERETAWQVADRNILRYLLMRAWCRYLGVDDNASVVPSVDFTWGFDAGCEAAEARAVEAEKALAELVRLKELKESDPRAYALEAEVAAKEEAWHVAHELLRKRGRLSVPSGREA